MLTRVLGVALLVLTSAIQANAAPPSWQVDPGKSALTFAVVVNGQTVKGAFDGFGTIIKFDPANLAQSSARITIDASAYKTGDRTRDVMLMKPAWFNVLDFPQVIFQTTGFVSKGGNAYDAKGKLTLKGITKDVTLPFTLNINGNTATMQGATTLKRLNFNIGQGEDFTGEAPVALSVKVMVNIVARRVN